MGISQGVVSPLVAFVTVHPILISTVGPVVLLLLICGYRVSPLHPLSHIPGPLRVRISSVYLAYHAYIGDESTAVHRLHERYGSVVRTGHNSVDITDGAALQTMYVEKGGFLKPSFYGNFDIDGHKSIFSAIDPSHRTPRAKAVFGIFSTSNLRAGSDIIGDVINRFVARVDREKQIAIGAQGKENSRHRIDMLGICRALAIDIVTGYLFGMSYGACEEDLASEKDATNLAIKPDDTMTASAMVDSFVAVGKFWYLSPRVFHVVERFTTKFHPDKQADQSIDAVDTFVAKAVARSISDKNHLSYPGRLLEAGFSESEVRAQCKDLIFAGTDSTAMNLATICFHLVKSPQTYGQLKQEIKDTNPSEIDLQSLPYLRGVIREGLRLSMANPSRLPRVVPPSGWTFNNTFFPAGTIVSCTPFELHLNPQVYTDPLTFRPERWLPENQPTDVMNRDYIPFGLGSRQCIARNLATVELFTAIKRIAEEDLLAGLKNVKDKIEILEWFNSHVVGGKIEMEVVTSS